MKGEIHQRAVILILIALALFLVLLFGGLILFRITQNVANDVTNGVVNNGTTSIQSNNYKIMEDGSRVNTGLDEVIKEVNGYTFSDISIVEHDELDDDGRFLYTVADVQMKVQNVSKDDNVANYYTVKFIGGNGEVLAEIPLQLAVELNNSTTLIRRITGSCVDAVDVNIEKTL